MGKTLVIAEKPSVAKDIGKVLKATKKGDGYIYNDEYVISWAIGHLVVLYNPEDYDTQLKSWNYNTLPIKPQEIKLKPNIQTKKQLDILKKLLKDKEITNIICATDSGREGELIFRYIYEYCNCKKPAKRLWISSLTEQSIKEGFAKLRPIEDYDNLYYSARCRSHADWLVGINATRAYTITHGALLSIGRVQTPTLAIMVDRQNEINNFIPEEYFEIKGVFDNYSSKWYDPKEKTSKIQTKEQLDSIINKLVSTEGTIHSVTSTKKTQQPPLLFDLTELQRECNRKYGFSAKKTLQVAQDLYEKRKLITYPRTDSRYISDDMKSDVSKTMNNLNMPPFDRYINEIINEPLKFTSRIVNNKKITDHHAIIPTDKVNAIKNLTKDEKMVYYIIVKRFIAVFFEPYIYNATTMLTNVDDELFISKGVAVVQLGYKKLYIDDEKEKEEVLPNLNKGDIVNVVEFIPETKMTKPPKQYNEATLLSAMENAGRFVDDEQLKEELKESGIGTPATRASIIERLLQVEYIKREGKNLVPTDKGMKIIQICPTELKSAETTGKWERGLSRIATGNMQSERFMESIGRFVDFLVNNASQKTDDVQFEKREYAPKGTKKNLGKCPLCDGVIYENTKAYFCSNWQQKQCKFTIWKNDLSKEYKEELNSKIIKELLKNKAIENISLTDIKTNETCNVKLILENENNKVKVTSTKL